LIISPKKLDCRKPRFSGQVSRKLICVLSMALLLRLLIPSVAYLMTRDTRIFYSPDTYNYIEPARQLIAHLHFANSSGQPELMRTPGYPLLIIPGLLLHRVELVTISLQILISCFTVYLVYRTTMLLFNSERVALLASFLSALEPMSLLYVGVLLSETLFSCIVMICVYYLAKYVRYHQLRHLIACGLSAAVSAYVRPISYFLPGIIGLFLVMRAFTCTGVSRPAALTQVAIFLLVSVGLLGVWQVRNRIETGYSGFSSIATFNMYFYSAGSVIAAHQHLPLVKVQQQLGMDARTYLRVHPEQKTWTIAQRLQYMSREAHRVLLNDPITFGRIHCQGIVRTVVGPGTSELLRFFNMYPKGRGDILSSISDYGFVKSMKIISTTEPRFFWAILVLMPLECLYLVCAAVGVALSRLARDPAVQATVLIATYLLVTTGGPLGFSRFRIPVMPIICIFAAHGLSQLADLLQRRGTLSLAQTPAGSAARVPGLC